MGSANPELYSTQFERLRKIHFPYYSFALYGGAAEAEDVFQDFCVQICKFVKRKKHFPPVKTIYVIRKRVLCRHLRKKRHWSRQSPSADLDQTILPNDTSIRLSVDREKLLDYVNAEERRRPGSIYVSSVFRDIRKALRGEETLKPAELGFRIAVLERLLAGRIVVEGIVQFDPEWTFPDERWIYSRGSATLSLGSRANCAVYIGLPKMVVRRMHIIAAAAEAQSLGADELLVFGTRFEASIPEMEHVKRIRLRQADFAIRVKEIAKQLTEARSRIYRSIRLSCESLGRRNDGKESKPSPSQTAD